MITKIKTADEKILEVVKNMVEKRMTTEKIWSTHKTFSTVAKRTVFYLRKTRKWEYPLMFSTKKYLKFIENN